MIIQLAGSANLSTVDYNEMHVLVDDISEWCKQNIGPSGARWQFAYAPKDGKRYGSLPHELIIPNQQDALMVRLKFGI